MEKIFTCGKCGAQYRMEIALLPENKVILAWQLIKEKEKINETN